MSALSGFQRFPTLIYPLCQGELFVVCIRTEMGVAEVFSGLSETCREGVTEQDYPLHQSEFPPRTDSSDRPG